MSDNAACLYVCASVWELKKRLTLNQNYDQWLGFLVYTCKSFIASEKSPAINLSLTDLHVL